MAKLHIILDPHELLVVPSVGRLDLRAAALTIPDDLDDADLVDIARKLAELLLDHS